MSDNPEESICLRCGQCCIDFYILNDDDTLLSEAGMPCRHLEKVKESNGSFIIASCKIHGTKEFPRDCRAFGFSVKGPCDIGIAIWRQRTILLPHLRLPELVKNYI